MRLDTRFSAYLQVAPLTLVFVGFLVFPLLAIVVVSFWDYTAYTMVPTFVLTNYRDVLSSSVTYTTYVNTFKYAGFTWFFTLTIGFTVVYGSVCATACGGFLGGVPALPVPGHTGHAVNCGAVAPGRSGVPQALSRRHGALLFGGGQPHRAARSLSAWASA